MVFDLAAARARLDAADEEDRVYKAIRPDIFGSGSAWALRETERLGHRKAVFDYLKHHARADLRAALDALTKARAEAEALAIENARLRELNHWAENALRELQRLGYYPESGCWCCVIYPTHGPGCEAARTYWRKKQAATPAGTEQEG